MRVVSAEPARRVTVALAAHPRTRVVLQGDGRDNTRIEGGIYENEYVRKKAGKFVSDRTKRRPMIVPVVMEA